MTITASGPTDVRAWITQRERIRTMRMQRHLAVAALASVALAAVGLIFPFAESLLGFSLIAVLVAVVLQSIARGLNAKFGWMWDWIYPEPTRATGFDRLIARWFAAPPVLEPTRHTISASGQGSVHVISITIQTPEHPDDQTHQDNDT